MRKTKFYELYFSPTGGTRRVSEFLTAEISDRLNLTSESIDMLAAVREGSSLPEFSPKDICLISVPSFAGRVPEPVVNLLAKSQGCGARAILNVVFGNRAIDDTLLELRDVLEEAGFVCTAAMETVTEHSIFRQFGAGRPDYDDEAELEQFADTVTELLYEDNFPGRLQVPGNYPYRERKPTSLIPVPTERCQGCGLCRRECPVHAIKSKNSKHVDENLCIGCMHCAAVCLRPGEEGHVLPRRDVPAELREKMLPHMSQVCSGRKENRLYMEREG